jgi:DNA-directed RNA polymerase specialized sigma24 family protein
MPFDLSGVAKNNAPTDKLRPQLYSHVGEFVRRMARSGKIPNLELEIDDLIQNIFIKLWLERDRKGFSSGAKSLERLTSAVSRPGKPLEHEPYHGELHHTFATSR